MDHGLLYGMGVFETFRTYGGRPFLLERHLERLNQSCEQLGIARKAEPSMVSHWISVLMEANGLQDAYIRYTVTAGEGLLGLPTERYMNPTEILLAKELPSVSQAVYENGRPVRLLSLPRNTPESPVRMKSLHYMNNILAKRELDQYPALEDGPAEGLMLTVEGNLAETIVSNIFFVRKGRLCTPDISTGILPGITRALILELAERLGIESEEGRYRWSDLLEADEVFTSGSVQEIVPITTLIGSNNLIVRIGQGKIGPLTHQLLNAYREKAGQIHEDNDL